MLTAEHCPACGAAPCQCPPAPLLTEAERWLRDAATAHGQTLWTASLAAATIALAHVAQEIAAALRDIARNGRHP